jgi:putative redox protein
MSLEGPKAVVKLADDNLFVGYSPSGHSLTIETDQVRNAAPTPMELLILALGSCTGVDVVSILKKKRQNISAYQVQVTGQRRAEHPRSYQRIQVHHVINGRKLSKQAVAQAIKLSEDKYCSVAATLRPAAEIVSTFEIIEG